MTEKEFKKYTIQLQKDVEPFRNRYRRELKQIASGELDKFSWHKYSDLDRAYSEGFAMVAFRKGQRDDALKYFAKFGGFLCSAYMVEFVGGANSSGGRPKGLDSETLKSADKVWMQLVLCGEKSIDQAALAAAQADPSLGTADDADRLARAFRRVYGSGDIERGNTLIPFHIIGDHSDLIFQRVPDGTSHEDARKMVAEKYDVPITSVIDDHL